MASDNGADSDLTRIAGDIQALKEDLARLVEHLKTGATETVSGEASRLYETLTTEGQRQAAALLAGFFFLARRGRARRNH